MKWSLLFLFLSLTLVPATFAGILIDSLQQCRFQKLATQMGLKEPDLKLDGYEVRIWYNMSFQYGEAQMVYILRKTQQEFTVAKYLIKSNKRGFRRATSLQPTLPVSPDLWSRLLDKNIITLPDRSIVFERLLRQPAPVSDTDRVRLEMDGSFTIRGQKNKNRRDILDGEVFYFEAFNGNKYRSFIYDNPRRYSSFYSECEELQDVVGILDELTAHFEHRAGNQ